MAVRVIVAASSTTIDMALESGAQTLVKHGDSKEITYIRKVMIAPENITAINPAFDVTPAELADVILMKMVLSDIGIVEHPNKKKYSRFLLDFQVKIHFL